MFPRFNNKAARNSERRNLLNRGVMKINLGRADFLQLAIPIISI